MMKRKKFAKLFAMMALSLTCMVGATGVTAYANVNEAEMQAAEQQAATEPIIPETEAPQTEAPQTETAAETTPDDGRVQGDAFSVPGNAEVLDDITDGSSKEFFTIQTKNNNTFYLVVDRSQNAQNVYMLSAIDESDLEKFLDETQKESEKETEAQVVIPEEPATEIQTVEPAEPQKNQSGNMAALILIVVLAAGGGIAYYFLKVKPGKAEDDVISENLETGDGLETENEDEEEE
ncbi:MAG: DUF4366 domain-containing protein [Anaerostipes sp.]|nr:DUF4366 domain-containing protein [Anaerostipes sp.]